MKIIKPDQVWCSDITYICMPVGFVYLTAVMDWHSLYELSWEVSTTMDGGFCINALQSATRRFGKPDIFNTDQGCQYTGNVKDLINALKRYFEFYNFERPYQSLNRNTPAEISFGELAIQRAA